LTFRYIWQTQENRYRTTTGLPRLHRNFGTGGEHIRNAGTEADRWKHMVPRMSRVSSRRILQRATPIRVSR